MKGFIYLLFAIVSFVPKSFAQLPDSTFFNRLLDAYESGDNAKYHFEQLGEQAQDSFQKGLYQYFLAFNARRHKLIDSALSVAALSEANFIKSNDSIYLPKLYHLLMEIYIPMGNLDAAMRYTINAEKLYRRNHDTLKIAHTIANRGIILHDLARYSEGIKVSREAINLLDQMSNPSESEYLHAMNIVGINFDDWNKPDSALFYYYRIVNRYEEKVNGDLVRVYNNMANTYKKIGNLDSALKYILIAYDYNRNTNDYYNISTNANNLGSIYHQLDQPDSALKYLTIGLAHANNSSSVEKLRDSNYELMLYYRETGDLATSMQFLEAYHQMKDSLFRIAQARVVAEIETKYETEKKDKSISLLAKENELQETRNTRNITIIITLVLLLALLIIIFYLLKQRASIQQEKLLQQQKLRGREAQINAAIQSEENERKRFAADLHDGMGQLIAALHLNVQSLKSNYADKTVHDEIADNSAKLMADIQKEIRNIAFNLMPPVLTKEGLLPAVRELVSRINKSNNMQAELRTFGLDIRMNEVFEINLYRILQEWISNVIKYAGATYIHIDFTEHESEIIISVEDDGTGFDVSNFEQSKGNGWRNINSRLNLLKAKMEIDTMPGRKHTTLIVNFDKQDAYTNKTVDKTPNIG
jgi:signal transduction histidine kinase